MIREIPLRLKRGRTSLPGSGDRLAIIVVGDVPGGENSRGFRRCPTGNLDEVTVPVLFHKIPDELAVRDVSDRHKNARDLQLAFRMID